MRGGRVIACAGLVAVLMAGCAGGDADPGRPPTVEPAGPVTASGTTSAPAGAVIALDVGVTHTALDPRSRTLGLATVGPDRLLLLDAADPSGAPRTVALPGPAADVQVGPDGFLLAMDRQVLRVDASTGDTTSVPVDGDATAVAALTDGRVAVGMAGGPVLVLGADGAVTETVSGLVGADALLTTSDVLLAVDRRQTALAVVEPDGKLGETVRAGEGATTAVADRFGRALVLDTAGGELLAFSTGPLLLLQRFPVPGAPYGLAYDAATGIAWVTLTATDELVGYDVAGGEPREVFRAATVGRPESVAVDSATGTVFVASAGGSGVQRLQPGVAG